MSIHFRLPEYECKNCKTTFIAYSRGIKCPKCKQPEESQGECYDFVVTQVGTMLHHKDEYGRFFPNGWFIGSYCEQVQGTIFKVFDYIEQNPEVGWDEFLKQKMIDGDGNEFTNEEYIRDLFISVDKELHSLTPEERRLEYEAGFKKFEEELRIEEEEKNSKKLVNRIKKSFISFISKIR